MKKYVLLTTFLSLFFVPQSHAQNSHLQPVHSAFYLGENLLDYYKSVSDLLIGENHYSPDFNLLIMPSFGLESFISTKQKGIRNYLVYREANGNIWYNISAREEMTTSEKVVEISKPDTELLRNLYIAAVKTTRYPENEIIGCDGVVYYISAKPNNGNLKTGYTWSPPKGSKMYRLTEIGHSLSRLIDNTKAGALIVLKPTLNSTNKTVNRRARIASVSTPKKQKLVYQFK